jgi:nucleotide-binding universal stress UspA family protein/CBS domain-containing protein
MRVLIATDGSNSAWHALQEAQRLLPLASAEVCVVVVAPLIAIVDDPLAYRGPHQTVYGELRRSAERELSAALDALKSAGIEAKGVIREGDPATELLAAAEDFKPELVVLGSQGRGAVGRVLLGSVSDALVHHWRGAVMVVRHPHDIPSEEGQAAVSTLMQPAPVCIEADSLVQEAAQLMRDRGVGFLPVVNQGALVGVLTDRDVVVRVMAEKGDPAVLCAGDVCTREVAWVTPQMPVEEAVRQMERRRVRRVVVVEGCCVTGVLSLDDLAQHAPRAAEHAWTSITRSLGVR